MPASHAAHSEQSAVVSHVIAVTRDEVTLDYFPVVKTKAVAVGVWEWA